ncbi:hypothetical protein A2685_02740 [Candidatus Woesebacteria bacterium RIFCSPHIGHO2_01_FULL_37_10]|uniref:KH type-2 domain-containing protein n=1 Tax=Candidatus Woesebacteria bacterium RIFCSPHIGHO2_01_FULL_37_10 TaxID=1802489 RepID=A0A1F7XUP9_9BACT|nr:MAG: hypothetical protein A2685_02740 [Candidatus Woesebacteria bacterium RIFCSPHIGHO2_01_FULL_37_10]
MKDFLDFMLKNIISDGYEIEEVEEEGRLNLNVSVDKAKVGLVIGKGGRIIQAIQDLVRVKARLENKFVYVNVKER